MARPNKAERVVKRLLHKRYGFWIERKLSYDRERAATEVYWAICSHLGNPDRLPPEYSAAYKKLCSF